MKYKYKCCLFLLIIILLILLYNSYRKRYYIIKNNFLDKDFIDNIYNTIISDKKWIYTTNIGNTKIKHNNDIIKRKVKANKMYKQNKFSYSKYEYENDANILKEIKNVLTSKNVLDNISYLTGEKITTIMDIFISKYEKGDFLSKHTDNTLGKYAFMIYLNKDWNIKCGGNLNIIKNNKQIDTIIPEYNKLILMDVYSEFREHFIDEVKCNKNRYAITGWFA